MQAAHEVKSNAKNQVKYIEVTRGEGPSHLCGIKHKVTSFDEANQYLNSLKDPAREGLDKCDFLVVWDDVELTEYKGTYFLDHSKDGQSLNEHIRWYAETYSGIKKPLKWSDDAWSRHLISIDSYKHEYINLMEGYEF